MSKTFEEPRLAVEGKAPIGPQHLADEVADLMLHKNSPVLAAERALTQVELRSGHDQDVFVSRFENDLTKKYGQAVLPDLLIFTEVEEIRAHMAFRDNAQLSGSENALERNFDANYLPANDIANVIRQDRNAIGPSVDSANAIRPNRNAIGATNDSANVISPDRNAIGGSDNAPANQSARFTLVENLLHDNPAIRDWMRHSCGTNQITQADLQSLLNKRRMNLDPARESVYHDLAILNANWNNPEFGKIQSRLPNSNVKYLDMSKVMDVQPVPTQFRSGSSYP